MHKDTQRTSLNMKHNLSTSKTNRCVCANTNENELLYTPYNSAKQQVTLFQRDKIYIIMKYQCDIRKKIKKENDMCVYNVASKFQEKFKNTIL